VFPLGKKSTLDIIFSINNAIISLPFSHAKILSSFFFGKSPKPIIDFKRLKYSSTCQRKRYKFNISDAVISAGNDVITKIYLCVLWVSSEYFICLLLSLELYRNPLFNRTNFMPVMNDSIIYTLFV